MENLFNNEEKYKEYTKTKENSIKNRTITKEHIIFGGEYGYKKNMGYINDFHKMPNCFGIKLEQYKNNDKDKKHWDFIKVTILKDKQPIFSFIRDYPTISMCYAHNDNMDYIVFTGENYQGFSIYNLTKETFFSYIPIGYGWCPIETLGYDEEMKELRTYGCAWGGDYEWRTYKINDLDNPEFNTYKHTIDD